MKTVLEPERQAAVAHAATMRALVYHGPGQRSWEQKPKPVVSGIRILVAKGLDSVSTAFNPVSPSSCALIPLATARGSVT